MKILFPAAEVSRGSDKGSNSFCVIWPCATGRSAAKTVQCLPREGLSRGKFFELQHHFFPRYPIVWHKQDKQGIARNARAVCFTLLSLEVWGDEETVAKAVVGHRCLGEQLGVQQSQGQHPAGDQKWSILTFSLKT